MLRPVTTSSASASAAPTAVHASAAAANSSAGGSRATAVAAAEASSTQAGASTAQTFRYNSFEFIYRQDIGRIILIGQSPETGERVIQVPSEHALRAYEQTAREERQLALQQNTRPVAQQTGSAPAPQLARALVAVMGGSNSGSALISISA